MGLTILKSSHRASVAPSAWPPSWAYLDAILFPISMPSCALLYSPSLWGVASGFPPQSMDWPEAWRSNSEVSHWLLFSHGSLLKFSYIVELVSQVVFADSHGNPIYNCSYPFLDSFPPCNWNIPSPSSCQWPLLLLALCTPIPTTISICLPTSFSNTNISLSMVLFSSLQIHSIIFLLHMHKQKG